MVNVGIRFAHLFMKKYASWVMSHASLCSRIAYAYHVARIP